MQLQQARIIKMTSQEVQAFFQDDNLTDEQMNLVHEFLMSQKVE